MKKQICDYCGSKLQEYYFVGGKSAMLCPTCDVTTDKDSGIVFLQ